MGTSDCIKLSTFQRFRQNVTNWHLQLVTFHLKFALYMYSLFSFSAKYTEDIELNLSNMYLFLVYNTEQCLPGNKKNLELRLTGSYGTLQSPEDYPPELFCEWLITVPEGNIVELSFERFELDFEVGQYGCREYVQIHDGDSMQSDAIENFCGDVIPKPVRSSGRHMYIRFQSDSVYVVPRRGFKATFKAVKEFRKLVILRLRYYNTLNAITFSQQVNFLTWMTLLVPVEGWRFEMDFGFDSLFHFFFFFHQFSFPS